MIIQINETNYFYKETGQGAPVILLHGNPDSADFWDGLVSHLSPNYRCIAPDLPGFGRSDIEKNVQFNLDYCADWLDAFISTINLSEPAHLIVHDVGTFFGISWAIKHPDKVKSICITNTLYFSNYRWHFWGRIWRTPIIGELSTLLMSKWLYKVNLKKASPKLSEEFLDKAYEFITPKMQKTVLKLYRAMSPSVFKGWEEKYLELTTSKPVCVIWGDRDPYIPLKFGFAERMANGQTCHRVGRCWTLGSRRRA